MANEIAVSASLYAFKQSVMSAALGRGLNGKQFTMTGSAYIQGDVSVGLTPTTIPLGGVTQPHWALFFNADPTNAVQLIDPNSLNPFVKLLPQEFCVLPLDPLYVPTALAHIAACVLEYLIVSL